MKINNRILTKAVLIMAAMVSAASATTTYTQGDLLLGFRSVSGEGTATNYVVNLGASSNFTAGVSSTINIGADLASIYGSGWATSTGTSVQWGVVGSSSAISDVGADAAGTVYYTLPGSASTLNNSTQSIASGAITTFEKYKIGYSSTFNGNNLQTALAQVIAANATNSWSSNLNNGTTTTIDFKLFPNIEGSPTTILNLYRDGSITEETAPALLGSFSLSSTGVLTFTAVPEPSAALLGGLGTLMLFTRRRRNA